VRPPGSLASTTRTPRPRRAEALTRPRDPSELATIATPPVGTASARVPAQSCGSASSESTSARRASGPSMGTQCPVAGSNTARRSLLGSTRPRASAWRTAAAAAPARSGWWKGTALGSGSQANRKGAPPCRPADRRCASALARPVRARRSSARAAGLPTTTWRVGVFVTPMTTGSASRPARRDSSARRRLVRGPEMATIGTAASSSPARAAATAESLTDQGCRAA
jgi:hypothetical protein